MRTQGWERGECLPWTVWGSSSGSSWTSNQTPPGPLGSCQVFLKEESPPPFSTKAAHSPANGRPSLIHPLASSDPFAVPLWVVQTQPSQDGPLGSWETSPLL